MQNIEIFYICIDIKHANGVLNCTPSNSFQYVTKSLKAKKLIAIF